MPVLNDAAATKELVGGVVLNGPVDLSVGEIIEPLEQQSTEVTSEDSPWMRSLSWPPSHHLPLGVVRLRSGNTISAKACQGMTRAS
jgi:hypothetical protein